MQLGHTAKIGIFQCFLFLFFFLCLFLFILLQRRKCLFPHQIKCCRYIMQEVGCIRYFLYIVGMIFEGLNKREIDKMEVDRSTTYPSACGGLWHTKEPGSARYLYFSTLTTVLTIVAHFWSHIKN